MLRTRLRKTSNFVELRQKRVSYFQIGKYPPGYLTTHRMLPPFPPEIIVEIALYLPLTEDVITLSLTSHAVRGAVSTPVLFKARLLLQGWDIDTWQDEDDKAQRSGDWKRWMRIDHIHSKTLQLLEYAPTGGLSTGISQVGSDSSTRTPQLRNIGNTL